MKDGGDDDVARVPITSCGRVCLVTGLEETFVAPKGAGGTVGPAMALLQAQEETRMRLAITNLGTGSPS